MTFKDNCLCYESCGLIMKNHYQNCEECDCFKDKSKIIELSCRTGYTLYELAMKGISHKRFG